MKQMARPAALEEPMALGSNGSGEAVGAQGSEIEAKEDIVKRLGRSPDCGDALVLSILVPTS